MLQLVGRTEIYVKHSAAGPRALAGGSVMRCCHLVPTEGCLGVPDHRCLMPFGVLIPGACTAVEDGPSKVGRRTVQLNWRNSEKTVLKDPRGLRYYRVCYEHDHVHSHSFQTKLRIVWRRVEQRPAIKTCGRNDKNVTQQYVQQHNQPLTFTSQH